MAERTCPCRDSRYITWTPESLARDFPDSLHIMVCPHNVVSYRCTGRGGEHHNATRCNQIRRDSEYANYSIRSVKDLLSPSGSLHSLWPVSS